MHFTDFCENCKLPFHVTEHNLAMPGTKEKEPIDCPYCKNIISEETSNGWWVSSKMTDKEIDNYFESLPDKKRG